MVTVLENMAGAGNVIGAKFEDLGEIVRGVKDKTRVRVCLDTCGFLSVSCNQSPQLMARSGSQATCLQLSVIAALPFGLISRWH